MYVPINVLRLSRAYLYEKPSTYVFDGHRHNSCEINYLLHGTLEVTYENHVIPMLPGDLLLIRPQQFHRNRVTSADGVRFAVVQFYVQALPQQDMPAAAELLRCNENERALCALMIEELQQQTSAPQQTYAQGVRLLEALLHRLFCRPLVAAAAVSTESTVYRQAVDYMQQHVCDHLQVADIARACKVCPTILKRVFTQFTGGGAAHYYLSLKMEYAKNALQNGVPSYEIANVLGFSSPAYFSQCFRRNCGCTPSAYKQHLTRNAEQ